LVTFAPRIADENQTSEKKIEQQLARKYDLEDPQFRRSMDLLPGPPVVNGNKVQILLNGDQIFPPMRGVGSSPSAIQSSCRMLISSLVR
jgi:hypothetical protein